MGQEIMPDLEKIKTELLQRQAQLQRNGGNQTESDRISDALKLITKIQFN